MHPNFLDQIIVFQAVAELGSYAEAARRLNRQVSAISYAITNLETHLGLTLVDRGGYRAGLTEEGQALLGEVSVLPVEEVSWLFHHVVKAALWQLKMFEWPWTASRPELIGALPSGTRG